MTWHWTHRYIPNPLPESKCQFFTRPPERIDRPIAVRPLYSAAIYTLSLHSLKSLIFQPISSLYSKSLHKNASSSPNDSSRNVRGRSDQPLFNPDIPLVPKPIPDDYARRRILPGRTFDAEYLRSHRFPLIDYIEAQHWQNLFHPSYPDFIFPSVIFEFYANLVCILNDIDPYVVSVVQGRQIRFSTADISDWFDLPLNGPSSFFSLYWPTDDPSVDRDTILSTILGRQSTPMDDLCTINDLKPEIQLCQKLITSSIIPRMGDISQWKFVDMYVLFHLISQFPFNLPRFVMQVMHNTVTTPRRASLPFGRFIQRILSRFDIHFDME